MNNLEFSNGFDTMLGSYSDLDVPALNEYEKSFFLTQALNLLVRELYSSTTGDISYECDEKTRRLLEALVTTRTYETDSPDSSTSILTKGKFTHTVFTLPNDCWYIVYEEVDLSDSISCGGLQIADVLPVAHDDYYRVMRNPFRGPTTSRVLRLDKGEHLVELVSTTDKYRYTVRYIRQPKPIVLENLPDESSIELGVTVETSCELPEELHWNILRIAVSLALNRENKYKSEL